MHVFSWTCCLSGFNVVSENKEGNYIKGSLDARKYKKIPYLFSIENVSNALGAFSVDLCGMLNISTKSPEAGASEEVLGLVLPLGYQKPTGFAIQLHIKENAVKKSKENEQIKLCKIGEL